MVRSHLERDPVEFVEWKIWASSESSPGFGRALCDSRIQIGRLAYIFWPKSKRTVVDSGRSSTQCSTNLPYFGLATSGERHELGRIPTRWGGPRLNACSWKVHIFERASGEVPERCKITGKARSSLTPPESATRSERFLNFDRGLTGPHPSLQIPRRICQFS